LDSAWVSADCVWCVARGAMLNLLDRDYHDQVMEYYGPKVAPALAKVQGRLAHAEAL